MSTEPESPPPAAEGPGQPEPPVAPPKEDDGTRGDLMALGIGCGVFVLMLIAVVLVGVSGR